MRAGPEADRQEEIFRLLYSDLLASLESGAGGPFAAAVLRGGELLGRGTNSVLATLDVSRHAEVNALAAAGRRLGTVRLAGAVLLTTHFPCLMCLHAAKWAGIGGVHYLFDYEETERLFGFRGDLAMLRELGLPFERLAESAALPVRRVSLPALDPLYRERLPALWNERYRERGLAYDVGPPPGT